MSRWIQKSFVATTATGTNATINFGAAASGNFLVAVATSNTTLSTPSGWTLSETAIGDQALYLWTKTATPAENQLVVTRSVADIAIATVVYEFPAGSTVIASDPSVDFNLSGVAVAGLSGMAADPKLLMHFAAYAPSSPAIIADIYFYDGEVVDVLDKASIASDTTLAVAGYFEDSTLTTWAPRLMVGSKENGTVGATSQRITVAFNVPPQLPTPVPTVISQQNPTTVGGTNGSISVTWPDVAGAATYTAGIATGHNQTSGYVVVESNVTSPYTYTGLAAGQYTAVIRAEP